MPASTLPRILLGTACLLAYFLASPTAQDDAPKGVVAQYTQGNAAMVRKDYQGAVTHFTRALAAAPDHPGLLAELARAEFLAGNRRQALEGLTTALRRGGGLDVAEDPALVPLLAGPEAAAARRARSDLRTPVSTSTVAFRLSERDLIPEGIAYDPVEKHFYVGSIYRRKIVRIDAAGRATTFVGEMQDGLLSVLGMKVDAVRRVLWAATEGHLDMKDARPADAGRSALVMFDLRSGRSLRRLEIAPDPGPHLFNDLAVDAEGTVYLTDSAAGSVYRVTAKENQLQLLIGPRALEYPNGIALASDGRRLFVAHVAGIAIVDLATRRLSPLRAPAGETLADIDGLWRDEHRLLAVQNGLSPARVVELALDEHEGRVTGVRILERGHPLFASIPTTGVVADGWYYYIANAQLRAYTPDHRILPPEKLQEPVILRTRLQPWR